MASGTRGSLDLQPLRSLVGNSKPLPKTNLPTLRDVLQCGIFFKESSSVHSRHYSISTLSKDLADEIVSVYKRANDKFDPGINMLSVKSLFQKIDRDWKKAVDITKNKGRNIKEKKTIF